MKYYLCKDNIINNNIHMKKKTTTTISLDDILEMFNEEDIIKADGFDDCIVGVESTGDTILVYSTQLILEKLVKDSEMTWEEAIEFFDYNIQGSKGEGYPIYILDYLWFNL
jgi:hypothetical protein